MAQWPMMNEFYYFSKNQDLNFKEYLYNSESRKTLSILKTRFTPRALNINTEWKSKSVFPNSENRSGESPNSLNIISI